MTISSTQTKSIYAGNGVTTSFPVPFIFFGASELLVIETIAGVEITKILGANYSVSGGNGVVGAVNAFAPPPVGSTWTIKRNTNKTQLTDYTPNDPFPAETHERALDRLAAVDQEQAEIISRSITIPISSNLMNIQIPLPGNGKFWRWDITGTFVEAVTITGLGFIALPISISDGGTSATTKDGAIRNLNLSPLRLFKHQNFM